MLVSTLVQVMNDRDDYLKKGVHKGDKGWLCEGVRRGSKWLVKFPVFDSETPYNEVYIEDDDLGCIFFH